VATIYAGGQVLGPAALVDAKGLFVAHQGAVNGDTVQARLGEMELKLTVVSRERNSELVLLRAEGYRGNAQPFVPSGEQPAGTLLMVLPTGTLKASTSSARRYGVLASTRRGVPIAEIRFEAPKGQFGTGLLLSDSMEFYGSITGSLGQSTTFGGNVGPLAMTVAYSIGPEFVRRVLEGFLSPSHEVVFPSLGVMCIDAVGGGALVQVVRKDSPADSAGILREDVLLDIGGVQIRDQLDFARAMLRHEAGKKILIRLRRGMTTMVKEVVLGRSKE
jgi:hypothetical protein